MDLARLVELVARVRATPRRTGKVELIAELLRQTQGRETELCALYLSGLLPQGRIGVGYRMLQDVAAALPPPQGALPLLDVDRAFAAIAGEQGAGSTQRRAQALTDLFSRADVEGRRFLASLIVGEVRQGALEGVVLEAIARAASLPAAEVRQAAMFAAGPGEVARVALCEGAAGLSRFGLRLLQPVAPMLASPAGDVEEALARMGEAAFEYKLDGARVQVHRAGDEVRVFTRQLQDVTPRVPELVELVRSLPVRELVLEGETIALRADGRPQPFQVTMRRFGRSREVAEARQQLALSSFFFDCLYLEGEGSLLGLTYAERAARLLRVVPAGALLPRLVTGDAEAADRFWQGAIEAGHEGLVAKSLEAPYAAGQRGFHWMKLKSAHTLDLVVLAVEQGSGRRQGWLSNLHLGARDEESGQFVMLGKTFKGLTDEMLRWQTQRLGALQVARDEWTVHVRPELVVEVAFSDVQESPRYPAGLALRFARIRAHRPEKPASQADTLQTVQALFRRQRE